MRNVAVAGLFALAGMGVGCGDDGDTTRDAAIDAPGQDANVALTEVALISNDTNRDLDLLFVVDDSPSMLDKQLNLRASFPSFLSVLSSGGLPNVHIGVISTDMGTMGADDSTWGSGIGSGPGSCSMLGKDGVLQTYLSTMINGKFISDVGGVKNYTGTIAERFAEISDARASGCGFEQPLHAIRRALDPSNTPNAGFLRPEARLGIVVLSDEDDCSMAHSTLIGNDTMTLGPLQSFRCYRFGVTCDINGQTPDLMNQIGVKGNCYSNESNTYLTDIGRYVTFLNSLKPDPRDIVFGAIVGNPAFTEVELRTPPGGGSEIPAMKHSCMYQGANGLEVADPAVRLGQVASRVRRGSLHNICSGNLAIAMTDLATRMKPLVGDACVQQMLPEPPICEAFDTDATGTTTFVPQCGADKTPPCFELVKDAFLCPAHQNYKINMVRSTPASAGTWTSVRCQL